MQRGRKDGQKPAGRMWLEEIQKFCEMNAMKNERKINIHAMNQQPTCAHRYDHPTKHTNAKSAQHKTKQLNPTDKSHRAVMGVSTSISAQGLEKRGSINDKQPRDVALFHVLTISADCPSITVLARHRI